MAVRMPSQSVTAAIIAGQALLGDWVGSPGSGR